MLQMFSFVSLWIMIVGLSVSAQADLLPTVIWHGMGELTYLGTTKAVGGEIYRFHTYTQMLRH